MGVLQNLGNYSPRILFKLWQKRLLDKNYILTQEEYQLGCDELEYEIKILNARIDNLEEKLKIIKLTVKGDKNGTTS